MLQGITLAGGEQVNAHGKQACDAVKIEITRLHFDFQTDDHIISSHVLQFRNSTYYKHSTIRLMYRNLLSTSFKRGKHEQVWCSLLLFFVSQYVIVNIMNSVF